MVRVVWPVAHKPAGFCIIAEGINAGRSVPNSKHDHVNATAVEDRVGAVQKRISAFLRKGRKSCVEVATAAHGEEFNFSPDRLHRCLHLVNKGLTNCRSIGIDEDSKPIGARYKLVQEPESLYRKLFGHAGDAGDVGARPVEAAHETGLDRVGTGIKNDRDSRRCGFGGECRRGAEQSYDHCHPTINEVRCQYRQPPIVVLRPAVLDRDILALGIAGFAPRPATPRRLRVVR